MPQHIGLFLEDERGKIIEKSNINFAEVINTMWSLNISSNKYPWISTIDPYGNTIFNVHQIPYLTAELENLKKEINDKKFEADVNKLLDFFKKIEQHLYIRFVGD